MGGGGGTTTVHNEAPAPTPEEQALTSLNTQLAQRQLANMDQLAPLQTQLIQQASDQLKSQSAYQQALDAAISPADQAAAAASQLKQSQQLGDIQTQLAQKQLDTLNNPGATPEQQKAIADATDAAIKSGTGDIDVQTQRGIGMISDELANARGLRLSDAPIGSEAALLTRAAGDQKSSLINSLRSNQANATLNYPLAVQGLQSGINIAQQQIGQSAQDFQAQLRQQAAINRMSITGQAASTGLGISSLPGVGIGALQDLTQSRSMNASQTSRPPLISQIAPLMSGAGSIGIAAAMMSDRRLKKDIKTVGELEPGIGIYTFKYKGDDKTHLGVMADEVERVIPEAVHTTRSGYKAVDYRRVLEHA